MYGFESFYFYFFIVYVLYVSLVSNLLKKDVERMKLLFFLFLPLFLLSALRGESVGGDLSNYLPAFDSASRADSFEHLMWTTNTEPGFKVLNWLISIISPTHRTFLVVTSLISLSGPAYLIYKYSKLPGLSSLLYVSLGFYTNTFNNVRQSIAISLCFIAIPFALDRKLRGFLFSIMLASTIHYSAIICFVIYPLIRYAKGIKSVIIILLTGLTLYFFARLSVIEIIINSVFVRYDPESILNNSTGGWGLFILYALILSLEIMIYIKIRNNLKKEGLFFCTFLVIFQVLAVLLQMYATMWSSMTRSTLYFYIPIIIAVPFFLSMYEKKTRLLITFGVFVLSLFFMRAVYSYNPETRSNSQGVIPYVFLDIKLW